jgi:hypothetical protein
MGILQALVADIVWTPEAIRFFNARIDVMVEDFTRPLYRDSPFPEIVDRAIYPKATSEPYALRWDVTDQRYEMDEEEVRRLKRKAGFTVK